MHFDIFLKYVPKVQNVTLPTAEAHAKMVPSFRDELVRSIDFSKVIPRKAAVMMLLYPKNEQTHLALILRTAYKGVHSAQIAFPGGKVEVDDLDLEHTAIRETHEEIGVHPKDITVIRAFTKVYIPPSNFMVYPFLGICTNELKFQLQDEEVAGIIELPLVDFLAESSTMKTIMNTSYAENIEVPGFKVKDYFIWGATAMMMSELKDTLKQVL